MISRTISRLRRERRRPQRLRRGNGRRPTRVRWRRIEIEHIIWISRRKINVGLGDIGAIGKSVIILAIAAGKTQPHEV